MARRGLLPKSLDPRRRTAAPGSRPRAAETDPGVVQIDTSVAVLADEVVVAVAEADGKKVWVLELTGRVHGQGERAALPFLLGPETAGLIVAGFVRAAKMDPELGAQVRKALGG